MKIFEKRLLVNLILVGQGRAFRIEYSIPRFFIDCFIDLIIPIFQHPGDHEAGSVEEHNG